MARSAKCQTGNIALLFALLLPVILGAASVAIDFSNRINQKRDLQELSDTLAIRGAREFLLANATESKIKALIEATAPSFYEQLGEFSTDVVVDKVTGAVEVTLRQAPAKTFLLDKFAPQSEYVENAVAVAKGKLNVCVIVIDDAADAALEANMTAKLAAPECAILSNSTSSSGVKAGTLTRLSADFICTSGGYQGSAASFDPMPVTDCPAYPDPLAARVPPAVGGCDFVDTRLGDDSTVTTTAAVTSAMTGAAGKLSGDHAAASSQIDTQTYEDFTLDPGVYCGGLEILSNANVTFNPGVYIIKDGPFKVRLGGVASGENVGFYLVGDQTTFEFSPASKINLTAPKDGLMAGLLFFEDRSAPKGRSHRILSDDARTLLGTFYLPQGHLEVASLFPVADQSAYTAIVARKVRFSGNPTLTLNTDYGATDIPVPAGIGPTGGQVILRE